MANETDELSESEFEQYALDLQADPQGRETGTGRLCADWLRLRTRVATLEAERDGLARVLARCASGEEAEYVDGMDGSEGTYENSFEEGVRFVCDRLRMLAATQEGSATGGG